MFDSWCLCYGPRWDCREMWCEAFAPSRCCVRNDSNQEDSVQCYICCEMKRRRNLSMESSLQVNVLKFAKNSAFNWQLTTINCILVSRRSWIWCIQFNGVKHAVVGLELIPPVVEIVLRRWQIVYSATAWGDMEAIPHLRLEAVASALRNSICNNVLSARATS